jgi:SHS2 domain-containing protein
MAYSFRFLDDVALADIAFEVQAGSPTELFIGATEALLQTLADPTTVGSDRERWITHSGPELSDLLFEWLSEIVYWKDASGMVFREAPLTVTCKAGIWTLQARLIGAPVDQGSQVLRNDVKGVTKHLYELKQHGNQWEATVVVDV